MKCPYCFRELKIKIQKKGSRHLYYCSRCESEIHRAYVDYPHTPFTRIGMVGYTGHGKTVYITSLFYQLQALDAYWDNYYFETLDDFTHDIMFEKVFELKKGNLFSGTPINFPEPAFIRFNNMPTLNTQIVSMYDIGGGVFDNLDLMTQKGRYLAHSDTIFFIMSLIEDDIYDDWNMRTMKLLDRYIHVVYSRFGANLSKKQNIVFVFTKSDELAKAEGERELNYEVADYFKNGTIEQFGHVDSYSFDQIRNNSANIETWLRSNGCNGFINLANNHFRSVSFVLTSSLGDAPVKNKLLKKIAPTDPKCVLDPFLWALYAPNIKPPRKWWFF
jgi:sarcosine oxidase delta subunit